MVKTKPSYSSEGNKSNNLTVKHKGQSSKPKRYRGKNTRTKNEGPELKSKTKFKGRYSYLEGYISDLEPRASKISPGQWRIWKVILGQTTAISVNHQS